MTERSPRLLSIASLTAAAVIVLAAAAPDHAAVFHERKEVAGLAVVFGAEPEPALTEEMQFLRWRVSSLDTDEPYAEISAAEVTVVRNGEEFGPFQVRPARGTPGLYQTRHIFTEPGEYQSVLTFRKGESQAVHSVDFAFRIGDRADLEIPRRRGGGS